MSVTPDDAVIVLDTNVISEPLRPEPDRHVLDFMQQISARTFITTVTLSELFYGAWRLPEGRRRTQLLSDISDVQEAYKTRTLTLTVEAAANYGRNVAELQRAGRQIGRADAYIAAICVAYGATLATRNTKDFDGYPDLKVIDPWEA